MREKILEALAEDTDLERLMIGAGYIKAHPDAADVRGGNQEMGRAIVLLIMNKL